MDPPTGPSQPSISESYSTAGNPIDHTAQERSEAYNKETPNAGGGSTVEARERGDMPVPSSHGQEPQPSSLGYGARDASGDKGGEMGASNTEAEQMAAPGEGDVLKAQQMKTGFGEQGDLASDLDRKKAEQASARESIKQQREGRGEAGGALGQTGGPATVEGR